MLRKNYKKPLSDDRLFGWHNVLFPSGISGLYRIEVGKYRTGEMQVVSGEQWGVKRFIIRLPRQKKYPKK